jgi:hypothetical protein
MSTLLPTIPVDVVSTPGDPWWRIALDIAIAVGTIGAAVAAGVAAILATKIAQADRQAADRRAEDDRREADRRAHEDRAAAAQPYITADIVPDQRTGQLLLLVIENSGRTTARNVRVVFDPPLESIEFPDRFTDNPGLTQGFPVMPPRRRYTYLLDTPWTRLDSDLPMRHHIRITGDGPFGPLEPLDYEIDLNTLRSLDGRGVGATEDIAQVLKKIEQHLAPPRTPPRTLRRD